MATLQNFAAKCFGSTSQALLKPAESLAVSCRFASKKSGSTTQNVGNSKPKHRGWKRQDGATVTAGTILATQNTTRFHPGLNVGFGRNGTLFAMHSGKVVVTCEKVDLNWEHTWIQRNYADRQGQPIYKKHFNIIPEPEHKRFKLIDKI
ncbi:50S ribosomal protein L27 [Nasonia vitripennis]|uniref:Large ribosomal subunit protein bL27m n=1 Tax=Nasonia vitripennis TaxID=7425 RepID=A0A7M7QW26_NASVI|nr:50S ribosomal protein L27 [Nasonia vitripennis]XP_032455406.1 50S ribosomal protein L27 [Nasonia vitripennis]XP_032455407.1 50S ribosomal protein L27 [Nasonia vitripennis]